MGSNEHLKTEHRREKDFFLNISSYVVCLCRDRVKDSFHQKRLF